MQDAPRTTRWSGVALGLALTALLCLAPLAASAHPSARTPPQLSIAVDDGHETAKKGERPTYTITLTNLGSAKVKDLLVTASVPVGSTFVSADSDGQRVDDAVAWKLDLKATDQVVLRTTLAVGTTPDTLMRLATVACARVTTKGPPVVCASDSDLLPAGAAAAEATAEVGPTAGAAPVAYRWALGGAGLAAVLGLGGVVLHRRRRTLDGAGRP